MSADAKAVVRLEEEQARAILANDADEAAVALDADWILVGAEGQVIERATFVDLIRSGNLVHDELRFADWRVRVFDDTAVATAEAWSGGSYQGHPFSTHERSTSTYVRRDGRWRCVLTQLTALAAE